MAELTPKNEVVVAKHIVKSFKIPLEGSTALKQKLINNFKGRRGYRNFTPLNDISFTVNEGDFFGVVGKNGSGKSTLLKTIAGIYEPNSGSITVNGSLVPFIELGVGFNPELTGRENVFLNGALLGFSRKEITAMYSDIVDFAELHDFMDERLKNYSSGMQVRLAFSIAIQAKGDILLLDEVLAVGDAAFQQKCFDYFEQLKRDKKTIIIVTHDMNAVKRFCNRALIIKDGVIEKIGKPSEIAELYTEENIEEREDKKEHMTVSLATKKRKFSQSDSITVNVAYVPIETEPCYVNVSFVYNGFVVADKNTKYKNNFNELGGVNSLSFEQRLNGFNGGKYDIHMSLHQVIDDKLIEHIPRAVSFMIEGDEPGYDGPMRLSGVWKKR
jgi:ABC-2 type transport system ATP-binding protein